MPNIYGGGYDNYSTEEQVIGTQIDGKPIYQKTWTGYTPTTSESTDIFSIIELNLDTLISIDGVVNSQNYKYPINHQINNGDYNACWLRPTTCAMKTMKNNATFAVTLRYTKTTD